MAARIQDGGAYTIWRHVRNMAAHIQDGSTYAIWRRVHVACVAARLVAFPHVVRVLRRRRSLAARWRHTGKSIRQNYRICGKLIVKTVKFFYCFCLFFSLSRCVIYLCALHTIIS